MEHSSHCLVTENIYLESTYIFTSYNPRIGMPSKTGLRKDTLGLIEFLFCISQIYSYIQRKNELNTSCTLTRVSCR